MKPLHWILASLLFLILGLNLYLNWYDNKVLSGCSKATKAFLSDVYHTPKKGYTFVYKYKLDNKIYKNHEWVTSKETLDTYSIGDSLWIEYACDDYQVSKVQSKK